VIRRLHVPQLGHHRKPAQRRLLGRLAKEAGIETPAVVWYADADKAIRRLKQYLEQRKQLRLDGMDRVG
jgi:hypothetical protein